MSAESINTNISSLIIQNNLDLTNSRIAVCLERLSSGLRINRPQDDPSGFTTAVHLQTYIGGLYSAERNANDAVSLTEIAASAVRETIDILQHARGLAVQSANGTNISIDRQELQQSIEMIKSQMSAIASTTNFNTTNLLDGSSSAVNIQTGALANQSFMVSLPNIGTNVIGSNDLTTTAIDGIEQANYGIYMEANGASIAPVAGLTNGIVASSTINLIPVTTTGANGVTTTVTPVIGSTAAQLATAINATALAKATAFTAVNLTGFTIANADTLTIGINTSNGVNIAGPVLNAAIIGGTPALTYSNVASAINSNLNMQTNGVYAIASATKVTIISAAGYDISAISSGGTATLAGMQILNNTGGNIGANTPLAAGDSLTAVGIVSLEVGQNVNATFGDNNIFSSPTNVTAGVFNTQTINRMTAQNLTLSGNQGSVSLALIANQTAADIAIAVNNQSGLTGINARAATTLNLQNLSASGTVSFSLVGDNGYSTSISANITTADFTPLIIAINNVSGTTGITAQTNGANNIVLLTDAAGNDIQIVNFNHSVAVTAPSVSVGTPVAGDGATLALPSFQSIQVFGNPADDPNGKAVTLFAGGARHSENSTVVGGKVTLYSANNFSARSSVDGLTYSGSLFETAAAISSASTFEAVAAIDISTSQGAQTAIIVLDQAIDQLSAVSSHIGAMQYRLESTISSLTNNIANMEQARAKITDADFAAETVKLTKLQMLAHAGVALLAQANAIPEKYLTLLRHYG